MADLQRARWILRIDCGPVGSCGSTVLQVFVRGSTEDRLRARPYVDPIWRIYCMPVVFCGSTAGQLDLAEPLFHMCLFADLLRIDPADAL